MSAIAAVRCSAMRSPTCLPFAGYDVTREYYVNDAGAQVDVLARSASCAIARRWARTIGEIPAGLYPGDYLKPVGAALAEEHGQSLLNFPEERGCRSCGMQPIAGMLEDDQGRPAALNIHHDVFFSERSLTKVATTRWRATIEELRRKGLVYEGRLAKPKGHDDDEWEDREQTLFKSTDFGDDVDRALMKSDGGYTYFAADIAYHHNKLRAASSTSSMCSGPITSATSSA